MPPRRKKDPPSFKPSAETLKIYCQTVSKYYHKLVYSATKGCFRGRFGRLPPRLKERKLPALLRRRPLLTRTRSSRSLARPGSFAVSGNAASGA